MYFTTNIMWNYDNNEEMVPETLAVSPSFSGVKKVLSEWCKDHPEIMEDQLSEEEINSLKAPDDGTLYIGIGHDGPTCINRRFEYFFIDKVRYVE